MVVSSKRFGRECSWTEEPGSGVVSVSWDREYARTHRGAVTPAAFAKEANRKRGPADELPPGLVASARLA